MLDVDEAVRLLKQLRCKDHYTNNEILEYHTCLNIIEEAVCEKGYVIVKDKEAK